MIVFFIVMALSGIVTAPLLLLPDLPKMPEVISDSIAVLYSLLGNATSFVSYLLTPALLGFILAGSLVMMNFSFLSSAVFWVLRKIPFIDIRQ